MPRVKPVYIWPIEKGEPLDAEKKAKQRVTYKSGGKKFKTSKPPASLPIRSTGNSDVNYGNSSKVEHEIRDEMRRLGL